MAFRARFTFPLSLTLVIVFSVFFSQDVFSKIGIDIVDIAPMGLLREYLELLQSVARCRVSSFIWEVSSGRTGCWPSLFPLS